MTTPLEDIELQIKQAQLVELTQRNSLQLDMGALSRKRAATVVEREQASTAVAKIQAEQLSRQEAATKANDVYYRRYSFTDPVGPDSVAHCMAMMSIWHRNNPGGDMEIVFTCPGGDVIQGFALYDFIRQMSRAGHEITTSVLGGAFSMAAMLMQAGDVRNMGKEAWLMFHAGEIGTHGTAGQVQDAAEWSTKTGHQLVRVIFDRLTLGSSLTLETLTQKIIDNRKDWWVGSEEAFKLGLVDNIL